jgi:hypothetical protein
MTTSAPTRRRHPASTLANCTAFALATLFVWLPWIDRPDPPSSQLDPSWQAVLAHAYHAGLAFGREIIFTHGPWGWLTSHFTTLESFTAKWIWEVAGKLLLSAGTVFLSLRLPLWRRAAFLLCLPLVGLYFPDTHFAAILFLVVTFGLVRSEGARAQVVVALVCIGVLSTMKFVYAVVGMSGVGLAVLGRLLDRRYREAALMALVAVGGFLVAWLLGGQSLLRLIDHVRMSLELSGGYSSAMSVDEPTSVFLLGAATTVVLLASCFAALRGVACRSPVWLVAVHLAFLTFVMWKHGFSRADGHVMALFSHALLCGFFAAPALDRQRTFDPFLVAACLGVVGMFVWNASLVSQAPRFLARHLGQGFAFVSNPSEARAAFVAALESRRAAEAVPELVHLVDDGTIDAINYHQGTLLLNDLRYVGRPVFQSYAAYTPTLMRRNLRFLQSDRAPEFLLWRHGTIDARFPSLDDALLVAEIPRRYETIAETPAGWLTRRREEQPEHRDQELREVLARHVGWGETFSLPPAPATALRLECLFDPSFVGRLRSLLYKPGSIHIVVTDDTGRETRHRLLPAIAEAGFLVHPFLETSEDVGLFLDAKARRTIHSVRFEPARPDERELWAGIHVRVFELPELPIEAQSPFSNYVARGIASHAPLEVASTIGVHILTDESPAGVLVHAPGHMLFLVEPETRRLTGGFGIRERAYQLDGHTDGVVFSIVAEDASGVATEIWKRTLRPLHEAADRGIQRFDIAIPEGTLRVRLVTGAGDADNTDWDWCYWNGLTFAP